MLQTPDESSTCSTAPVGRCALEKSEVGTRVREDADYTMESCAHTTTKQVPGLLSQVERYPLTHASAVVQSFEAALTLLQRRVVKLLGVPPIGFRG